MKFAGLTALSAAIIAAAVHNVLMRRRKIKILFLTGDFFCEVYNLISLYGINFAQAADRISNDKRYALLSFPRAFSSEYEYGCNIKKLWVKSVENSSEKYIIGKKSADILCEFSEVLGRNSYEGFREKITEYSRLFIKEAEKEEKIAENKGTLIIYSGVLAAAVIAVAVI